MKKQLLFLFISAILISCTTSRTTYKHTGKSIDTSTPYSLSVSRYSGTLDSARMTVALREGFEDAGLSIDTNNSAINKIVCSCDLGSSSNDILLWSTSEYSARLTCTIQNNGAIQSFETVGSRTVMHRLPTTLASVGMLLLGVPAATPFVVGGGAAVDVALGLLTDDNKMYMAAISAAASTGIRDSVPTKKMGRK